MGTAAAYLHFSFGIVAGFDGVAQGRYFLGPVLSILSALAIVALWRVWLIGGRLRRYGAYINALPRERRYDVAGVVSAVLALVGFGAIARPIYRTAEVIAFGILLAPAAVLATVAFVRGCSHSQANASDTAVDEGPVATFNAPLHLADLPGLVCGTRALAFGKEHVLDSAREQARNRKSQRETGVVLTLLDCDDGLPRNLEPVPKFLLRPSLRFAQVAQLVVHL